MRRFVTLAMVFGCLGFSMDRITAASSPQENGLQLRTDDGHYVKRPFWKDDLPDEWDWCQPGKPLPKILPYPYRDRNSDDPQTETNDVIWGCHLLGGDR
mgnify:CR=1 FL=1